MQQRRRRIEADLGYVPAYPLTSGAAATDEPAPRAPARAPADEPAAESSPTRSRRHRLRR